jgi:hypothetical protein
MKVQTLFSITTLPLLLSSLVLAPVSANPVQPISSENPAQNLIAQGIARFARISEISGSTVTVVFRDGSSQDIQVSSGDMKSMNLMQNKYVVVAGGKIVNVVMLGEITKISGSTFSVTFDDKTTKQYQVSSGDFQALNLMEGLRVGVVNNMIVGVASVGKIIAMAGGISSVQMLNGDLLKIGVSRAQIGAMNLMEGKLVYVADGKIVAVADTLSETRLGASAARTINFQQQPAVQVKPDRRPVVRTQVAPVQPPVQPVQKPMEVKKPVRGLW